MSPSFLVLTAIAAFANAVALPLQSPGSHENDLTAAVASDVGICSQVGISVIDSGGNAADASIAVVLCVGVVAPASSGIGGGGFMTIRSRTGEYEFIDFRERAPAGASEDMYMNNTEASLYGGLASGIPGEIRGLEYLHNNYGSLPWAELVKPSVHLAREGFEISKDFVKSMNATTPSNSFLYEDPAWAIDFAPNGTLLGVGDIMTRKRLANTLEAIADHGPDAFYHGAIANATVSAVQKSDGILTLDDLSKYTVQAREPLMINYRGYKLTGGSAPSSGPVVLAVLKTIEGFEMGNPQQLNQATHLLDEAIKFGYGQRALLGDPSFVEGVDQFQIDMIKDETGAEVRSKILTSRTLNTSDYDPGLIESLDTPGTTHISTADQSGLAVSLTTTVNLAYGSQLIVPETGVVMNNEMNDFSIPESSNSFGYAPSPANFIRPGKTPLSSMSPTIVEYPDGTLYTVLGAAGGSRIVTCNIQNLWNVLDRNLPGPQALVTPRFHDQLIPNQMTFEYTYDNSTVAYLKGLGHNVTWVAPGQSKGQIIRRLFNGTFEAASEPRLSKSGGFAT